MLRRNGTGKSPWSQAWRVLCLCHPSYGPQQHLVFEFSSVCMWHPSLPCVSVLGYIPSPHLCRITCVHVRVRVCVCVCTRACKWHLGILQPACRWILVFACTCLCDQSSSSGGRGLSKLRFFSPAASPSAGILRKRQLSTDSAAVSDQSPTSPSAKVSRCLHTQLYVFMHVKLVWVK